MKKKTRIVAAINVSPESFYAGSVATTEDSIAEAARRAEADGADLLDIGAMSTAPYKETCITEEEEIRRISAAIPAARRASTLPISADTSRAAVGRAALEAGATWINDVTAFLGDAGMSGVVATSGARVILMANDAPGLDEAGQSPVDVVARLLAEAADRALTAGVARDRIVLDPGIGFFRNRSVPWYQWDVAVLRELPRLQALGYPLVIGASRKSFIGELIGRKDPAHRLAGSLAVACHCARHGVDWLRVHDVRETRDALAMLEAMGER